MATWTNIHRDTYRRVFDCPDDIEAKGNVEINLQYDADSITPVSATLRYKLVTKTGSNYWDKFYIVTMKSKADGTLTANTLYKIKDTYTKDKKNNWPYYSSAFTVSKKYNASTFSLPALYLIDNGNDAVSISSASSAYTAATGSRKSWTVFRDAANITILGNKTIASAVTQGTCSITDNYNNTFTLYGTKGGNGTNNTAGGPTLKWGYTTDYNGAFKDKEIKKLVISETTQGNATRKVYAKSITTATYGSNVEKLAEADIKQYVAPTAPSNPRIEPKAKKKLTVRDNWKLSWTAGEKVNDSSPVMGYRVRLYKKINGVFTGLQLNKGIINVGNGKDGNLTNVDSTHADYYYFDTNSTSTELELDPVELGLTAGDYVKLGVFSYTKYGASNEGGQLFCSNQTCSQEYLINNAGIVRVKVGGDWKEGQVWVKVDGTWKEATSVHTKVNGSWKEST